MVYWSILTFNCFLLWLGWRLLFKASNTTKFIQVWRYCTAINLQWDGSAWGLFGHFESLFHENEFEFDVIDTAFAYYIKVFSNLRLRDLCQKYNSKLDKTTTVGLRQSLATHKPLAGSVKKRTRKKLQSTTANNEHDSNSNEDIHNALRYCIEWCIWRKW